MNSEIQSKGGTQEAGRSSLHEVLDCCIAIAAAEEKEAAGKGGEVSALCPKDDKEKAFWNGYWSAAHNIAHDLREQSNS